MTTKKNAIQEALDYHEKYGAIPKDYMERLSWLYDEVDFTKKHLDSLISKIDELANVQWNEVNYIFYMTPKPTPRPRCSTNTFHFYVGGAKMNKQIFDNFIEQHSDLLILVYISKHLLVCQSRRKLPQNLVLYIILMPQTGKL